MPEQLANVGSGQAVRRVLLDSNIVDHVMAEAGRYETARRAVGVGSHEFLFTHVNIDEIAEIPDIDRRQHFLLVLVDLGTLVATGATALGYSRLNFCRLVDDDEVFEAVQAKNLRHTRDALLLATAVFEQSALATNDDRLRKRAIERGVEALTAAELFEELERA